MMFRWWLLCVCCLLVVSPVRCLNVVSHRRARVSSHALEQSLVGDGHAHGVGYAQVAGSRITPANTAGYTGVRDSFCTNWGPVIQRIQDPGTGFVFVVYRWDPANPLRRVDIYWVTSRTPDLPQCSAYGARVAVPGCPGTVCEVDLTYEGGNAVRFPFLQHEAHVHFDSYNQNANHNAIIKLSLKDTCVNDDANYHWPAGVNNRLPGTVARNPFNPQTCVKTIANYNGNYENWLKYRTEAIRAYNAMFG